MTTDTWLQLSTRCLVHSDTVASGCTDDLWYDRSSHQRKGHCGHKGMETVNNKTQRLNSAPLVLRGPKWEEEMSPEALGWIHACMDAWGWCSELLGCHQCLFELVLPFCHMEPVCPFSSHLSHPQGLFIQTSLIQALLYKPWRWLHVSIHVDQRFLKYPPAHVVTNNPHQVPFCSLFWCLAWTSASCLDTSTCHWVAAMWLAD